MTYKFPRKVRSTRGFFRSSTAVLVAGASSGLGVIATAVDQGWLELRAALVAFATAALVAGADYLSRRRRLQEHEDNVTAEHEKTRALIRKRRSPRAKILSGFKP